ncbi:class I SAM-dependent methyltransferase [Sulfurisoma sediminicola]|uniref:class I SAM-dependent methyltransferase n=1 Tax=Sulfurisoma sediminicola TaxID=1381557 RepID=UPI000F613503|nr:methyltransferase domain-containing protein [Sulfurisoma sediminicola]
MKVATVSEARISDREKQLQRLLRQGLLSRDAIEGKVVLDWECGDAAFAVAFSRLGASKVYAIDSWVKFDDEYVDQLTQLNVVAQNISIREFSSVATAKADLIFANTVTEHLQDLPSAFQNVFGLLKPNGYFFVAMIIITIQAVLMITDL